MNDDPLLKDYLTREEAAAERRVCERTLERWARLGKGPKFVRIGRTPYLPRRALRAFLAECEKASAA